MSGPAIHYFLQIQHAFEEDHTRVQCRNLIDEYVNHHDGGLTVDTMRAACELPPRKRRSTEPSTLAAITDADATPPGSGLIIREAHLSGEHLRRHMFAAWLVASRTLGGYWLE